MKKGYSLVELTVYMALIVMFFSFLLPSARKIKESLSFSAEVKSVEHMLRYARQVSILMKAKSVVVLSDKTVKVFCCGKVKEESLSCKTAGQRYFAFSNGIPYVSGKMLLKKGKRCVSITVYPITGMLISKWE